MVQFSRLHCDSKFSQHYLLKRFFSPTCILVAFSKVRWLQLHRFGFMSSILFHWPVGEEQCWPYMPTTCFHDDLYTTLTRLTIQTESQFREIDSQQPTLLASVHSHTLSLGEGDVVALHSVEYFLCSYWPFVLFILKIIYSINLLIVLFEIFCVKFFESFVYSRS